MKKKKSIAKKQSKIIGISKARKGKKPLALFTVHPGITPMLAVRDSAGTIRCFDCDSEAHQKEIAKTFTAQGFTVFTGWGE